MDAADAKNRFLAASELLRGDAITIDKLHSIRDLIRGINPRVDELLNNCLSAVSKNQKLEKSEVIELSQENLPENTEEETIRDHLFENTFHLA